MSCRCGGYGALGHASAAFFAGKLLWAWPPAAGGPFGTLNIPPRRIWVAMVGRRPKCRARRHVRIVEYTVDCVLWFDAEGGGLRQTLAVGCDTHAVPFVLDGFLKEHCSAVELLFELRLSSSYWS